MKISFQYCQFLLANKIICQEDQIYISSLWVWNMVNIESLQWFLVMKTSLANLRLNWNSCCLFLSPPTGHPGHHTKQGNWPWRDCGAHLWEDRCEGWRWAFSSVHTGALTCLLTIGTCATQVKRRPFGCRGNQHSVSEKRSTSADRQQKIPPDELIHWVVSDAAAFIWMWRLTFDPHRWIDIGGVHWRSQGASRHNGNA